MTLSMGPPPRSRTGEKMIMHLPRPVAPPVEQPRRRRYGRACFGIKISPGREPWENGGKEPGPRIVVERRICEDHIEGAPLRLRERPRVADVRFERLRTESGGGRAQRFDQRAGRVHPHREL